MIETIIMPPPTSIPDDDAALLRQYCANRAELAFRTLVERHLPSVWSAARRIVNGDEALAEDIAQEVFAHLAMTANKLPPHVVLGGWLHRHTCYTATKAVRTASRRRAREQAAAAMNLPDNTDPWPDLAPRLDAALNALSTADRDAVVLRFFEKRDFRSIGTALGTTEDGARVRTSRAVEKLRGLLGKRSTLLTVALLSKLLSENSMAAPPSNLVSKIVSHSMATAATAGGTAAIAAWLTRTSVITAAVLAVSSVAAWQWWRATHRDATQGIVFNGNSRPTAAALPEQPSVQITVHFIRMPEPAAAAIMEQRWNSDEDTKLLQDLLNARSDENQIVSKDGIKVHSGQRAKLELIKEFPFGTEWEPGDEGLMTPIVFTIRNVGTTAEIDCTIGEDGHTCSLTMTTEFDFAAPKIHVFPSSPAHADDPEAPGAKMPEFRYVKATSAYVMDVGDSMLVQCSPLPILEPADALHPERILTFVTIEPSQP
jgi:RNA polymerase sigma factor (sigma-70 family)